MKNQTELSAELLVEARKTGHLLSALPQELVPRSIEDAYRVQDEIAQYFGVVGGWKVGASSQDAVPLFAPMPEAWIRGTGATLRGQQWRFRAIEAEVAFLLSQDLPIRSEPYTRTEVVQAIESCHPAIEVLETGFTSLTVPNKLSSLADLQLHGGFVYGPPAPGWKSIDFATEHVTVSVNGKQIVSRTGSNTAVDLVRLVIWLANEGGLRTGGLCAGQWITTGSWTGNTPINEGEHAEVAFSTLGPVSISFDR